MRNLKRALSLGLTAAMISGLMVMGSSAASYADVTSENNVEAIEVLQAVGIMVGDENGDFNPDQNVTRNEMAVIMANLMEYNVATYKDTSPFTDVPSWAEPYVAACWTNGITAGYSDTIYGGSDTVTTAQAALMLMKALGYFQYASDFGGDWQLATTRQGNAIDLFTGVDSGVTQAMTRNDVAQLVLNTLRSGTVEASTDGNWTIGDVTITNNVQYSYITSNQSYATAIDDARSTSNNSDAQRSIVELGEQLYMGDLKLNDNAIDDFGRPSRTWNYEGAEVGTYAKTELLKQSYTTGVTGREMYDLLTASTINENDVMRYVDGVGDEMDKSQLARNNKDDLDGTGNGVLTEVYLDDDNDQVTIASINTYLAQAIGDYSADKEYAPLEVYDAKDSTQVYNVDVDDVPAIADVVDEGFYLVNISYADGQPGDVTAVMVPEIMENSTVTKWSDSTDTVVKKLTVDGTEYNAAKKAFYDEDTLEAYDSDLLTDMTYNIYLDQYGYAIGVDVYEGDLKYVFVTGYDRNSSNLSVSTATAAGIFLDGTMEEIKVNVKDTNENINALDTNGDGKSDDPYYQEWTPGRTDGDPTLNRWYRYSVNEAGVYTLKPVSMTATLYADGIDADKNGIFEAYEDVTINTANVSIRDNVLANKNTRVYGEDESVYVTVNVDDVDTTLPVKKAITEVDGVYTGVQNVDLEVNTDASVIEADIEGQVYTVYDKDNYVIGAVVIGEASGTGDYAYITSDGAISEEKIGDTYYWEFEAILDGEFQTLTAKSKYTEIIDTIEKNRWNGLELRFDADGYVIGVDKIEKVYDFADAQNENVDIDDYDVYFINPNKLLELNLQGRTLYITEDQKDMGLALASDAKAVVVQPENGKSNVITEFTTVKSAISHLADPYDQTSELEYRGEIFAVLNSNGSGAWIVFNSDTELRTGDGGIISGGGNQITNGNVTLHGDVNVDAYGVSSNYYFMTARVDYTLKVEDDLNKTLPAGTTVTYDVSLYSNGQYIGERTQSGIVGVDGIVRGQNVTFAAMPTDQIDVVIHNVNITIPGYSTVASSEGVTLTYKDGAGKTVVPYVIGGVDYVKNGNIVTTDKNVTYGTADVSNGSQDWAANTDYVVNSDVELREIVKVTLNDVTAVAADGSNGTDGIYSVVKDTELTLNAAGTGYGIIEGTDTGSLIDNGAKVVAAENVTYSRAVELTLYDNVSATVNGKAIQSGNGVQEGATINVYVNNGDAKVISVNSGNSHGTLFGSDPDSDGWYSNTVTTDLILMAGVKVTKTGDVKHIAYDNNTKLVNSGEYVRVGTELTVYGNNTNVITVTGTVKDQQTVSVVPNYVIKFTLTNDDITVNQVI